MSTLAEKRHSLAHALASAILELYPEAQPTIGPATDTGFYYDFGNLEISEKELPKVEKKMRAILASWNSFDGKEVNADEAKDFFKGNPYKLELIDEIEASGEKITFYTSGTFCDLCRGGHVKSAKEIAPDSFALDTLAGAYWRGDEKNTMLTRIYGIAFENKDELDAFKIQREEAVKRDHRKIGRELDLFTFSDLVGPGLPLFTPRGTLMREALSDRLWEISKRYGYEKVSIPHLAKLALYETSGHAEKFKDEFFYVNGAQSGDDFVMKPMNCPHHTQIFASSPKSYRNLPARYSELTMMYRDEKPGQLLGLSRVRSITIDDAHVFCTPDQIGEEIRTMIRIFEEFYTALGMWNRGETFFVSLSVRSPATPEKYLGTDENWAKAEKFLQDVSDELKLDAVRMEGEAAFYGPKLDFMFKDALGRERQLATAQVDFVMPERFGLEYTDSDGTKKAPVMLHRAVSGSLERFMAIMIEHFAGNFPLWLSPEQVRIIPINSDTHGTYAEEVLTALKNIGLRATLDLNDSLGKRVRNAKQLKIPYFLIIGDAEVESKKVTVESRDKGKVGEMHVEELLEKLKEEIDFKS